MVKESTLSTGKKPKEMFLENSAISNGRFQGGSGTSSNKLFQMGKFMKNQVNCRLNVEIELFGWF